MPNWVNFEDIIFLALGMLVVSFFMYFFFSKKYWKLPVLDPEEDAASRLFICGVLLATATMFIVPGLNYAIAAVLEGATSLSEEAGVLEYEERNLQPKETDRDFLILPSTVVIFSFLNFSISLAFLFFWNYSFKNNFDLKIFSVKCWSGSGVLFLASMLVCTWSLSTVSIIGLNILRGLLDYSWSPPEINHAIGEVILKNPLSASGILMIVCVIFLAPFTEELLFRGCFQRWLERTNLGGQKRYLAIFISSLFFSLAHYGVTDLSGLLGIFFVGSCFGWVYARCQYLFWPIALHSLYNGFQLMLALAMFNN